MLTYLELMRHATNPIRLAIRKTHVFIPSFRGKIHKATADSVERSRIGLECEFKYVRGWIINIKGYDYALADIIRAVSPYLRSLCVGVAENSFPKEDVSGFVDDICNGYMDQSLKAITLGSLRDNCSVFKPLSRDLFKTKFSDCLIKRLEAHD